MKRTHPQTTAAPARVYRVGFDPDVAQYTEWRWQKGEGRWDDPRISRLRRAIAQALGASATEEDVQNELCNFAHNEKFDGYRVLYTADSKTAAYVEILQDFRKPLTAMSKVTLAAMDDVEVNDPDVPVIAGPKTGIVPTDFLAPLYVGEIDIEAKPFVDIERIETVQYVRAAIGKSAAEMGINDVSRGELLGRNREFTQLVSILMYLDAQRYAGMYHHSAIGTPHGNYAVFETPDAKSAPLRAQLRTRGSERVLVDDPDLSKALGYLGLEVGGVSRAIGPLLEEQRAKETRAMDSSNDR